MERAQRFVRKNIKHVVYTTVALAAFAIVAFGLGDTDGAPAAAASTDVHETAYLKDS